MSKRKRRHLTAEFKARVAKEALKEEQTIQQIAKDNDIAPTQVSAWKKELEERMTEIFDRKNAIDEAAQKQEKLTARLERKVGQLVIEKEFLEKSAISWGSISAKGSQFTGQDWIGELKKNDILVSMDGKGRWMDNLFIERLWRILKYEKIRFYSYNSMRELRENIRDWMEFYNHERMHQHLDYTTPWSNYAQTLNHGAKKAA